MSQATWNDKTDWFSQSYEFQLLFCLVGINVMESLSFETDFSKVRVNVNTDHVQDA